MTGDTFFVARPSQARDEASSDGVVLKVGNDRNGPGRLLRSFMEPTRGSGPFLQDLKMPNPKDHPKSPEWRPYIFARDQWHCRICGDRFQYSETVRKQIAHAHDENMPPSMYEYFRGAVWQRKKIP